MSVTIKRTGKSFCRMAQLKIVEGVFAVNKPSGISSAQVIRDLQQQFNPSSLFAPWINNERDSRARESKGQQHRRRVKEIQVKIGHGGTLDPLATGVLITGVGRGTKSLHEFLMCTKEYEAIILFGTSTDTYDRLGKVLKRAPYEHLTKNVIEKALEQFRGKIMQLPPLFSALKMDGKPLYEYARQGKEIPREIQKRPTEVFNLEIVEWMDGGTHPHLAPTDEAGYPEINVANKLWTLHAGNNVVINNGRTKSSEYLTEAETTSSSQIKDNLVKVEDDKSSSLEAEAIFDEKSHASESSQIKKRRLSDSQENLLTIPQASKKNKIDVLTCSSTEIPSSSIPGTSAESSSAKTVPSTEKQIQGKLPPAVRLRMTVTSGFYVRSLCHDLGTAVGSAALLAELTRTRQGEYQLGKNTLDYEDLRQGEKVWGPKVEHWLFEWQKKHPDLSRRGYVAQKESLPEGSQNSDQKTKTCSNSSEQDDSNTNANKNSEISEISKELL